MVNPARKLNRWIPGLQVWYGLYTGSWWAYVPGRPGRLIEAATPEMLVRRLAPFAKAVKESEPGRFGDEHSGSSSDSRDGPHPART